MSSQSKTKPVPSVSVLPRLSNLAVHSTNNVFLLQMIVAYGEGKFWYASYLQHVNNIKWYDEFPNI